MALFSSQKNVFWQALVAAVLIFSAGLIGGYALEKIRLGTLEDFNDRSNFYLLDSKIQNELYSLSSFNCAQAFKDNIDFSNKIYEDFKKLEKYDNANRLTESIMFEHRKYDLLRALFWTSSLRIKEKCSGGVPNIVYIYAYDSPPVTTIAKQDVFATYLHELQIDKGDSFLLIPLAGDNRVSSISFLMNRYNVTKEELPVILVDEKIKINNIDDLDKIENYLSSGSSNSMIRLN